MTHVNQILVASMPNVTMENVFVILIILEILIINVAQSVLSTLIVHRIRLVKIKSV